MRFLLPVKAMGISISVTVYVSRWNLSVLIPPALSMRDMVEELSLVVLFPMYLLQRVLTLKENITLMMPAHRWNYSTKACLPDIYSTTGKMSRSRLMDMSEGTWLNWLKRLLLK